MMATIFKWFALWLIVTMACFAVGWLTGMVPRGRSSLDGWGMD